MLVQAALLVGLGMSSSKARVAKQMGRAAATKIVDNYVLEEVEKFGSTAAISTSAGEIAGDCEMASDLLAEEIRQSQAAAYLDNLTFTRYLMFECHMPSGAPECIQTGTNCLCFIKHLHAL